MSTCFLWWDKISVLVSNGGTKSFTCSGWWDEKNHQKSPEKFILVWLGGTKIITCSLWWDNFGFYLQPSVGQKKYLQPLVGQFSIIYWNPRIG